MITVSDQNKEKEAEIVYIKQSLRIYSPLTFRALFEHHGFQVEHLFVTKTDGHLLQDADLYNGEQLGIIVKYEPIQQARAAK